MRLPEDATGFDFGWYAVGITAACLFYGRFYLQWIASERRGRSVVPTAFWYLSAPGSFLLLCYAAFYKGSPIGALSHSFNTVIYARNLVHIWREKGVLSRRRYWLAHLGAGATVTFALTLLCLTWLGLWREAQAARDDVRLWTWIAVGVAGQGLFACRFLLQWAVTEARGKSVVPGAFWYISLVAAVLLMSSHLNRPEPEWVFVCGLASTLPIYLRNIWMLRKHHQSESTSA